MSDNATFAAFTEALNAHTKALNAFVAATKSGGSAGSKPAETKAETSKPASTKGKKAVTKDQLTEAFGAYLSVKDKDEKKERAGHVQAISKHFEVERISLLEESDYAKALGFLEQFKQGEDPFADGDGDEEGDEGDSII